MKHIIVAGILVLSLSGCGYKLGTLDRMVGLDTGCDRAPDPDQCNRDLFASIVGGGLLNASAPAQPYVPVQPVVVQPHVTTCTRIGRFVNCF